MNGLRRRVLSACLAWLLTAGLVLHATAPLWHVPPSQAPAVALELRVVGLFDERADPATLWPAHLLCAPTRLDQTALPGTGPAAPGDEDPADPSPTKIAVKCPICTLLQLASLALPPRASDFAPWTGRHAVEPLPVLERPGQTLATAYLSRAPPSPYLA